MVYNSDFGAVRSWNLSPSPTSPKSL